MDTEITLQDKFLDDLIERRQIVSVFLINGIKLQGVIDQKDDATLVVKSVNPMLVYKQAISTIMPANTEMRV